ncbi:ABC transporter ATP-binding protein [Rhodoferax lacus]|uniref:ABC transporter ATP-binding protein n=1 Tax=Rhodoferax lacus TaxID=2184758 RepID=A0A3E1RBM1_9BURK|nr:ABC transporter ATP-binding protein [Rhodoferax lacus]RFO96621.1 ABC transporter ATP-binding protein [Rhodoferax lacus]
MSAAMPDTLQGLCWPVHQAGAALEELARRAGLADRASEVPALPAELDLDDSEAQARWMDWAAGRLGLEAEAVATPLGGFEALLRQAAPALLHVQDTGHGNPGLLLVLKARGHKLQLIGTDLALHTRSATELSAALCTPLQAPYIEAINHLLKVAEVPEARSATTRQALLHEHLAAQSVCSCWLLRAAPGMGFWQQLRQARLPHKVLYMLLAFAAVYAAEIAAWAMVGNITLGGHLDLGWLAAWGLLVLSLIPLHLLGGWLDASFALDMGRMLKTRLLAGILQSDLDAVRKQGAGQLLSRVMESQALESLALNGGMGVLVALLELGIAAAVLASGAGGHWHVLLLALWLLLSLALSWRYFQRLRRWTLMRLDMTHGLVERMVGHRTRLAQERPWRRDAQDDLALRDYLDASAAMDRAIIPAAAVMPRGWMLVGLLGLAPAFVAGNASAAALAVALGGMLLANRALMGISAGLAALSRAAVAWQQVAGLFQTRAAASGNAPYLAGSSPEPAVAPGHADAGAGVAAAPPARKLGALQPPRRKVIDASQLRFGYGTSGEPLLNGLDLTVYSGEQLLLEGPSGGGKSTLASLLVGLRQPHSGLLLLNGLDRHTLGDAWHQLATEAPQFHENHILSGTLAYNLLMGRNWPASTDELNEARALCEELGLGPLLQRMPSGLMQMVGETGWQLSHGERSRIFLARALLQKAELTVLDESFAALDPQTLEQCLLCTLKRSRALLVIAHP